MKKNIKLTDNQKGFLFWTVIIIVIVVIYISTPANYR